MDLVGRCLDNSVGLDADEGHGVRKPENLRVLYQRLIEFFESAFED